MSRRPCWADLYAGAGACATVLALRRAEPARVFGLSFPGSVAVQAVTVGTGLSAPLPLVVALPVLARRGRTVAAALAATVLVGALGEPVTWRTVRRPNRDPAVTAVVLANVLVPSVALLRLRHPVPGARPWSQQPTR